MATHDLALYSYWRSSSSYRVRIALAIKGVPFTLRTVNLLKGEQRAEAHVTRSPMGYVPCLMVDGVPFVESVAIIELLDDLYPQSRLYPVDPFARARVRALVEVINSGTQPLQNLGVLERVSSDKDARAEWLKYYVRRGLGAFEELLSRAQQATETGAADAGKGHFCLGAEPTAADVFLVPQLYVARRFSIDLEPFPRIRAAGDALLQTDFVQRAAPENQPDADASAS